MKKIFKVVIETAPAMKAKYIRDVACEVVSSYGEEGVRLLYVEEYTDEGDYFPKNQEEDC